MKKAICTTTINHPTEALRKFAKIAQRDGWHLFIAGDKKTPHESYKYPSLDEFADVITYIDPDQQEKMSKELSDAIGWNCIQRRNFSILEAYRQGAEVMALVDDDNIPYDSWGQDLLVGKTMDMSTHETSELVFDPLTAAFDTKNSGDIWHRGFPIQMLPAKRKDIFNIKRSTIKILVQADLWDGDPDIDAACRITLAPEVKFEDGMEPFTSNKPMPFNSQNTFIHRDIIPTYFLFPHIGRMDDIWAAYMAQYKFPQSVAFCKASVYQARNPHDLSKDLEAEMIGYRHTLDFVKFLFEGDTDNKKFPDWFPVGAVEAYRIWKKVVKGIS